VEVLNGTVDFYRYFDATKQAEFLYDCVEDTLDRVIPNEVTFLQNYDAFKRYLDNNARYDGSVIGSVLEQGNGALSNGP
jgi:hypothetical protein